MPRDKFAHRLAIGVYGISDAEAEENNALKNGAMTSDMEDGECVDCSTCAILNSWPPRWPGSVLRLGRDWTKLQRRRLCPFRARQVWERKKTILPEKDLPDAQKERCRVGILIRDAHVRSE